MSVCLPRCQSVGLLANMKGASQCLRGLAWPDQANGRDPEGRYLAVDGFTGTDSFEYCAVDDMGHFTKATVTVEVWDLCGISG